MTSQVEHFFQKFKLFFVRNATFLGSPKRFVVALQHAILPIRQTYAQQKEDITILKLFNQLDCEDADVSYIDVGANHPSDISNTYLLYRKGYSGFLVEPNKELCQLLSLFRKRDRVLPFGVGLHAGLFPFYVSKTPVSSTFSITHEENYKQKFDMSTEKVDYIAVLPLDSLFASIMPKSIGLLSIDVEGWNVEVLKSAKNILGISKILCIEYDDAEERSQILDLCNSFTLVEDNDINLILIRNNLS
jgi:FkbM family methyltransferase